MTKLHDELVEKLRLHAVRVLPSIIQDVSEAADAIEAQAATIEKLRELLDDAGEQIWQVIAVTGNLMWKNELCTLKSNIEEALKETNRSKDDG